MTLRFGISDSTRYSCYSNCGNWLRNGRRSALKDDHQFKYQLISFIFNKNKNISFSFKKLNDSQSHVHSLSRYFDASWKWQQWPPWNPVLQQSSVNRTTSETSQIKNTSSRYNQLSGQETHTQPEHSLRIAKHCRGWPELYITGKNTHTNGRDSQADPQWPAIVRETRLMESGRLTWCTLPIRVVFSKDFGKYDPDSYRLS